MIEWTLKDAHCSGHPWASQVRSRPQMELIYTTQPILEDWSVPYIESESTYRLLSYFIVTRFRSEQEVVTAVFWAGAAEFFFFYPPWQRSRWPCEWKIPREETSQDSLLYHSFHDTCSDGNSFVLPVQTFTSKTFIRTVSASFDSFLEQTPEGLLPRQS